jgi:hypothetical protein
LKFLIANFAVTENLCHQAGADGFAGMHRNYCNSSVRMLEEVVASLDSANLEAP